MPCDGRLARAIAAEHPWAASEHSSSASDSKLSTSVGRVLVCEELRECEALLSRSASDGNTCEPP